MDIWSMILVVVGLCVFEVVSSLDNAVVNADVLATMSEKWRKWFLVWGIFFGVFLIRGLLPWIIVWAANPSLGPLEALSATFSSDPKVHESIEASAPYLMLAGGVFLVFLFLHWLFLEPKNFGLNVERFFVKQGVWFYTIVSLLSLGIVWITMRVNPSLALSAMVGSTVFFLTHGFKEQAQKAEVELKESKGMSDISKLIYLEILDATFSVDGVVGAFAFTMSVPLIILGNGIGAIVVRQVTIKGVDRIRSYPLLKNGAMYSIGFLGLIMISESFGAHIPNFLAPVVTISIISYFVFQSIKLNKIKNK